MGEKMEALMQALYMDQVPPPWVKISWPTRRSLGVRFSLSLCLDTYIIFVFVVVWCCVNAMCFGGVGGKGVYILIHLNLIGATTTTNNHRRGWPTSPSGCSSSRSGGRTPRTSPRHVQSFVHICR